MDSRNVHARRYASTLKLISRFAGKNEKILDIGIENPFSEILKKEGYRVTNTKKADLDLHPDIVKEMDADVVTALEILEHLVSPFPLLQNLPGKKLIATVPLRLWFKPAYRNPEDAWDCHYHEFEDWQFDWLLDKSGWKVLHREKWTSPGKSIGIRPLLRKITPRYYAVYAERK